MIDPDEKYKIQFARELLNYPENPFKAGLAVFGADTGKALKACTLWVHDDFVIKEIAKLKEENPNIGDLPTKEDFARAVIKRAEALPLLEVEDYVKLARLYADVMGYIEKPQTTINTNLITNKVMVVKDHGTDEAWERRLLEQQRSLKDANATKH